MTNMTVNKHAKNGDKPSTNPLSMSLPYFDEFFDKFMNNWPSARSHFPTTGSLDSSFMLSPNVDIVEDDKSYKLTAELPGLEISDINLDVSDGVLTLSGEKKTEKKEEKEGNYHLMERSYGSFKRSFSLPPSVEEEQIKADFKKGILTVSMPKSEKAQQQQRKIQIKE